jgi:serine/threonine protein kinase
MLGKVKDFQLLKFLGKGTFGAVYTARREADGNTYAIKKVDTRRMPLKERQESVNEIRVLASIQGAHVITFYEAFVESDILYIVTELATHGDLLAYLKNARRKGPLPEATVWSLFIQMTLGIQTLHDRNILHRDLKAANVFMFSNNYLKLGDFGVSKVLKSDEALARTQVGTPYYVAPEVWRNRPYNAKCDMWSLGCLLYELCTYRPPFEAESMESLARKIIRGKFDMIPAGYSQSLKQMTNRLLVIEPPRRAGCSEVLAMDAVRQRVKELPRMPSEAGSDGAASPDNVIDLVDTIQVPRKFNDLTKKLPPPRYDVTPAVLDAVEANLQRPRVAREPARKPEQRLPELPALNPVAEGAAEEAAVAARRLKEQQRLKEKQREEQRAARHEARHEAQQRAAAEKLPAVAAGEKGRDDAPGAMRQGAAAVVAAARRQAERAQQQQAQGALAQARQVYGAQAPPPGHLPPPRAGQVAATPGRHPPPSGPGPYGSYNPREIRMVYHHPHGASKVSIFSRDSSYYNPITHQRMYQPVYNPYKPQIGAYNPYSKQMAPTAGRSRYPYQSNPYSNNPLSHLHSHGQGPPQQPHPRVAHHGGVPRLPRVAH